MLDEGVKGEVKVEVKIEVKKTMRIVEVMESDA